jgi:hypothetical protein
VFAEIKRLQPQEDRLLGNYEASKMLRGFVPDILAKLYPRQPPQAQQQQPPA